MNKLKHIIFGFFLLTALSVGASAQRQNEPKKPPPKQPGPTVKPGPEKPPPSEGKRPKKPGSGFALVWRDEKFFTV